MSATRRERTVRLLRRRKWQILWALGVLLPVAWAFRLLLGSPPVVTPSKDTTFLTGRTLPDGSLDFSAALWHHCNTPIEDSENAAVLLRELGPPQQLIRFLNRYAMILDADPEHNSEIFAAISIESLQAVRHPWTSQQFPAIAKLLEEEAQYIEQWKVAIARPAIAKPIGTTIHEVRGAIYSGAGRCLAQAMMHAGEGEWDLAVENFKLIDRAAHHLSHLQCGWLFREGLTLRIDVSRSLTQLIRISDSIDLRFAKYVRRRCDWPVEEPLLNAINSAIRIQAQINVRDTRDPENGHLDRCVGQGLTTIDAARDAQLTHLRNSVDWETIARIQNEAIDEYLTVLERDGLVRLKDNIRTTWIAQARDNPNARLIPMIRDLTGEDITVPLAWTLAINFAPPRINHAANQAVHSVRSDRAAVFAIAIAQYKFQHGRWPVSTDELANRSDAIDPTTLKPFSYPTNPNEQFPIFRELNGWSTRLHL